MKFEKYITAKEGKSVYRTCPFCGEEIWDNLGMGSGFSIHLAVSKAEHENHRDDIMKMLESE